MAIRRRRRRSLAAQTFELGVAAPQVIAHRLALMASAGAFPSALERAEFHRMGTEKMAAASEAWGAMATQAISENQKIGLTFMQSLWFPWSRPAPTFASVSRQLNNAAVAVLGEGMAPLRRRVVANARRLGRIHPK